MKSYTIYAPEDMDYPRHEVKHTEDYPDLFTVGYVHRAGAWDAQSDHKLLDEAKEECDRLNDEL